MNKILNDNDIATILQAVYQTNITAAQFDALKSFFDKLPPMPVVTPPTTENTETEDATELTNN